MWHCMYCKWLSFITVVNNITQCDAKFVIHWCHQMYYCLHHTYIYSTLRLYSITLSSSLKGQLWWAHEKRSRKQGINRQEMLHIINKNKLKCSALRLFWKIEKNAPSNIICTMQTIINLISVNHKSSNSGLPQLVTHPFSFVCEGGCL